MGSTGAIWGYRSGSAREAIGASDSAVTNHASSCSTFICSCSSQISCDIHEWMPWCSSMDDLEALMELFKCIAATWGWPEEEWALCLLPLFPPLGKPKLPPSSCHPAAATVGVARVPDPEEDGTATGWLGPGRTLTTFLGEFRNSQAAFIYT